MKKILLLVFGSFVFPSVSCGEVDTYSQRRCKIEDEYAIIWMSGISTDSPQRNNYNIQFDVDGLTIRFPPSYFAPDWSGVTLEFTYPFEKAESGELVVVGANFRKPIGIVKRGCWAKVKKFLSEKNINTRIVENTQK